MRRPTVSASALTFHLVVYTHLASVGAPINPKDRPILRTYLGDWLAICIDYIWSATLIGSFVPITQWNPHDLFRYAPMV
jgi:hypothetical protein